MDRPRGLLLTAWIMVALKIVGCLRLFYAPHHAQLTHPPAHLHVVTTTFVSVVNIIVFVCIFYYAQGRNWARIAILLISVLSVWSLVEFRHVDAMGQVILLAWALLGVFFLYWLNTGSVRAFFKRGTTSSQGL